MADRTPLSSAAARIPPGLQLATAYAWRLLLLAGAGLVVLLLLARVSVVVLPVIGALFLAALRDPIARRLRATPLPNWVGALVLVLATLAVVVGVALLVVPAFVAQLGAVNFNVTQGIQEVQKFAVRQLPVSQAEFNGALSRGFNALQSRVGGLAGRVLGAVELAAQLAVQAVAVLFLLFFFLKDGGRFHAWLRRVAPEGRQSIVENLLPGCGAPCAPTCWG